MTDGGKMGLKKHIVHGLVEFDITHSRESLRQYKNRQAKPFPSRRSS
jgi:hypothetical protein